MTRLFLVLVLARAGWAQSSTELLARLDQTAAGFKGVKASMRNTNHNAGVPDEVQSGVFLLRRDGPAKIRMRLDFSGANTYTISMHDQVAEQFYPKMNTIEEYDIRKFKEITQTLLLLGFGMSGKQLAVNYEIKKLQRESVNGEKATRLDLVPKSPEVLKQLSRIELWISDITNCAAQQKFYFKGDDYKLAQFSDVRVNPNISTSDFDLPKTAKRTRMN